MMVPPPYTVRTFVVEQPGKASRWHVVGTFSNLSAAFYTMCAGAFLQRGQMIQAQRVRRRHWQLVAFTGEVIARACPLSAPHGKWAPDLNAGCLDWRSEPELKEQFREH